MRKVKTRDAKPKPVRTSVTIVAEDHEQLERIAEQKKVSVAWVIREAIECYLSNELPLFGRNPR